ncbi:PREDICTED: uncharacterized protein LOC107090177 isoform X2 [Cyprinodon variegatus]|uniref:uncharacterized protein LOC107090177 isoform X2 n=1 Tax=Cyprinodon variegatus TaxID=28743 RepID=UPI000742C6B2|nr:PREDICTED: uncharacterized protein LOC107090177 isoform X2 [Cyprinodon variegatus]
MMLKLLFLLCFLETSAQKNTTEQNMVTQGSDYVSTTTATMEATSSNMTTDEATNTSVSTLLTSTTLADKSLELESTPSVTVEEGDNKDSAVTTPSTTAAAAPAGSPTWAYVLLVLIIIVIIVLCIILYMLRRASRMYSFDLQRPVHSGNVYEPSGTFGQVYLDDLDRPSHKDVISDDLSTTPIPNGTSSQLEEKAADEENAPQEQPEANDLQNPSTSSTSSLSVDDLAEKKSNQMSSNNLFFDAVEEPQTERNENNNNPFCSTIPFVEINLDEPAWSEQLLSSAQPSSSVLPFSSFSFSSSSSSSS